jgi:UDPglucose 6-dehydrogenase
MNIAVIGTGYVGLVTSACFAKLGHTVIGADNDPSKIEKLNKLRMPIYEPGLEELVKENVKHGRISFTSSVAEAVKKSTIIFICVGTPPLADGGADLSAVEKVARLVAEEMTDYKLVVDKSTVPVHTGEWVKKTIQTYNKRNVAFDVASNPEFLREGTAIHDFMNPDRIVIGADSEKAKKLLSELYKDIDAVKVVTDVNTSELIKHASNSFLAMKISFANALSRICEKANADVTKIAEGMGYDKRIGRAFLNAGPGFGGFCFPKDVSAFIHIADKLGYDFHLLKSVEKTNEEQKQFIIKKVEEALWVLNGKTLAVLGLAFKPNTDDIRFSPAMDIVAELLKKGVKVVAYDPEAMENAKKILKDIKYVDGPYETMPDADALLILTDWEDFKNLDLAKVKGSLKAPVIVDARNLYDPKKMKEAGFTYNSVGRPI